MPTTAIARRVEREHLAFALALHRVIAPETGRSACWSPFSVGSALGLVATGARGRTRAELIELLLGSADGVLADHATMLADATRFDDVRTDEELLFGVSNTLWTRPDIVVLEGFTRELLAWPNGAIRDAPFTTDLEGARSLINREVAETTRGLLPEVIPPGTLRQNTVAALVNALYLRAAWTNPFPERSTESRPFHATGGDVDVPTMRLTARLGHAAADGWQAVTVPAMGGVDLSILLPDGDLAHVEPTLTTGTLTALLDARRPRQVDLFLPRFRVTEKESLRPTLEHLGVRTVFTPDADLSGISDTELMVDKVLHDAVLSVDEHGLEGAAATAVTMRVAMAVVRDEPVVMRVDRPFLALVRHRAGGAVYFFARVVRP